MIKLDVKPYCHECLDFSPDVTSPQRMRNKQGELVYSDTIVRCEYNNRCANIKRYLERQSKAEGETV